MQSQQLIKQYKMKNNSIIALVIIAVSLTLNACKKEQKNTRKISSTSTKTVAKKAIGLTEHN
nr:hypothetical protein BACY1_30240 [Tenacibaculum mesophilum]